MASCRQTEHISICLGCTSDTIQEWKLSGG